MSERIELILGRCKDRISTILEENPYNTRIPLSYKLKIEERIQKVLFVEFEYDFLKAARWIYEDTKALVLHNILKKFGIIDVKERELHKLTKIDYRTMNVAELA